MKQTVRERIKRHVKLKRKLEHKYVSEEGERTVERNKVRVIESDCMY